LSRPWRTLPAAAGRIWRPTCCVSPIEERREERRMRHLILALFTLVAVLMVAGTAARATF
jgi:hypothetical protein